MSEAEGPVVLVLRIEAALLPWWFEEVKKLAAKHVRRMAVIEKPDEYVVKVELDRDKVDGFHDALQERWSACQAGDQRT